jgi:hypothetical protein
MYDNVTLRYVCVTTVEVEKQEVLYTRAVSCRCFGTTYRFHHQGSFFLDCFTPEDGTDTLFRIVGKKLQFDAAQNRQRAQISFTTRHKPEIAQSITHSVCVCVCVCSPIYPAFKAHPLYYIVICDLSGSTAFFTLSNKQQDFQQKTAKHNIAQRMQQWHILKMAHLELCHYCIQ